MTEGRPRCADSANSIKKSFNEFLVLRSLDFDNENSSAPSNDVITKFGLIEDLGLFLLSLIIQMNMKITYLRSAKLQNSKFTVF